MVQGEHGRAAVEAVPGLDVDGLATDRVDMTPLTSERSIEADPQLMAVDGDSATVAYQAAIRLGNLDLSRAWNAWQEMRERQHYFREVLESAARRFANPLLYRAINKWQEYHSEAKKSMKQVRRSFMMMRVKDLIYAWTVWRNVLKRDKLYRVGIMAFVAKSVPQVKMAFFTWRSQLTRRPETKQTKPQTEEDGLCRALSRCFARDGLANPSSVAIEALQA